MEKDHHRRRQNNLAQKFQNRGSLHLNPTRRRHHLNHQTRQLEEEYQQTQQKIHRRRQLRL
jgi:hypothetical protein